MEYRKATFADIEEIYHLVNDYATDGVMLARSRNTLYETLRDMIVAIDDEGKVVGVGEKYFTLTYKPGFFQKLGFQTITKEELPHKVWKECIDCPKFPNCDEIAMVRV